VKSILAYPSDELGQAFAADGLEPYRAGQIARWVYGRGVRDFADMTDLGAALRARLAEEWSTRALALESVHASRDGTRKLVLETGDGARLEAVIIPEERRRTVCVSSQIGCSLDCSFCATGRMGLGRNLRPEEIVDQVLLANEILAAEDERVSNLVFMGMGEPLLNLRSVVRAIRVLIGAPFLGLGARRITVSTAGVASKLAELAEAASVRLAVSLHATTNAVRDELVPLNRRFPLERLLEACRSYPLERGDRISFEYALIRGVNDSLDDVRRLVRLLHGVRAKVNLIPLNEHPGTPYRRTAEEDVDRFADALAKSHVNVTVRRSRGDDIYAACGQLGALAPHAYAPSCGESRR
jgi:23S rRNA (adenine2503-C2)-methyltransferase